MSKMKLDSKLSKENLPRKFMTLAIQEMRKSVSEHLDRADPNVGAILVNEKNEIVAAAHRGELRVGEHAEYTLIERKLHGNKLNNCTLYTTLEPCVERKYPKKGCAFRIINARIKKVYIGKLDPDPTVSGYGREILKNGNIDIDYFDKDLSEIILAENKLFFDGAIERAKLQSKKELILPSIILEREITSKTINSFSEEAQDELIIRANLKFKLGSNAYIEFLEGLNLIKFSEEGKVFRPTGLGILLIGKNPQNVLPQSRVKFTIEIDHQEPIIKDFSGPLVLLPDKIEDYLETIFLKEINRTKFQRKQIADIPITVLREVILNSIIHRNYTIEGAQTKVYICDDKVEVFSPGTPSSSIENFKTFNVPSISMNPKIAYIFSEMGYMEERGVGIKELSQLKSSYGLPNPGFRMEGQYFVTSIYKSDRAKMAKIEDNLKKLTPEQRRGFSFVKENKEITSNKYSELFNISDRQARRHLGKMIDLGLVYPQGEGKSRIYKLEEEMDGK